VWTGTLLLNEYPKRVAKFSSAYKLGKGDVVVDRMTLSQGQLAVEGHLRGGLTLGQSQRSCMANRLLQHRSLSIPPVFNLK